MFAIYGAEVIDHLGQVCASFSLLLVLLNVSVNKTVSVMSWCALMFSWSTVVRTRKRNITVRGVSSVFCRQEVFFCGSLTILRYAVI